MKRVTGFLIILFSILMLYGIFIGEPLKVLKKATTICLDCIGIG